MGAALYLFPVLWALFWTRDVASYPPGPDDATLLRVAPKECLFYAFWAGRVEPKAASANRTERLLAEPEVRKLYSGTAELAQLFVKKSLDLHGGLVMLAPEGDSRGADKSKPLSNDPYRFALVDFIDLFYTCPAVVFVEDLKLQVDLDEWDIEKLTGAVVIKVDRRRERAKRIPDAIRRGADGPAEGPRAPEPDELRQVRIGKAEVIEYPSSHGYDGYLALYGDYLIVAIGRQTIEEVIEAIDGRRGAPDWLTKLRERAPTDRLANLRYYNVARGLDGVLAFAKARDADSAKIIEQFAAPLGIANTTSVGSVSGLEEPGVVRRTIIETRGAPRGLLAGIPDRPLTADDLKMVPKNVDSAFVGRFQFGRVGKEFDEVSSLLSSDGDAPWSGYWAVVKATLENELEVDLAEDVFAALGQRWCLFEYGGKDADVGVFEVRETARMQKTIAKLRIAAERRGTPTTDREIAGHLVGHTKKGDYCWCLSGERLVVTRDVRIMERYLSRAADAATLAVEERVAKLLAGAHPPSILRYAAHDAAGFKETYELVYNAADKLTTGLFWSQGTIFPMELLPSRYTIEKHLTWSLYSVRRTDYGLAMESRSVLPRLEIAVAATLVKSLANDEKPPETTAPAP